MKMTAPTNLTSIVVDGTTYKPDKKGIVEVDHEHGPKLLDFGFLPVDDSIVLAMAPTQEDIDQMHKAANALLYIEAYNRDNPHDPIGPDAAELKAAYEAEQEHEKQKDGE